MPKYNYNYPRPSYTECLAWFMLGVIIGGVVVWWTVVSETFEELEETLLEETLYGGYTLAELQRLDDYSELYRSLAVYETCFLTHEIDKCLIDEPCLEFCQRWLENTQEEMRGVAYHE